MKKLFIGVFLLLCLIVASIIVLPNLIPASAYKDKIEAQLSNALERDVTIAGDVKLSVFPVLKAQTGAITIDNADGFTDTHFVTMDGLDARIRLIPLLSKKVEVSKFELTRPVINLEKRADGAVNWTIGDAPAEKDGEPFKRDGRLNSFDPNIGQFAITDGQISYRDKVSGADYNITNAGLSFSLPSLKEAVDVDGAMVFNGTPIDLDVSLDTPSQFLNGEAAGFVVNVETEFAKIKGNGQFTESQEITFNAALDGTVSDMAALTALVPQEVPYANLVNSSAFSGDFAYDGKKIVSKNSDLSAKGDLFDAEFKGDATISLSDETPPIVAGFVAANVNNVPALAKALDQTIDGVELLQTANVKANLTAKEDGFLAENIDANLSGNTLNATYKGRADIGETIAAQGQFTANASDLPNMVKALKLDLDQEVFVDKADLSGELTYRDKAVDIRFDKADLSGQGLVANYQGDVALRGEDVTAKGNFSANASDLPRLVNALKLDLEQDVIVKTADVSGQVAFAKDAIDLTLDKGNVTGDNLTANYLGTVTVRGEAVKAQGNFTSDLQAVPALLAALKVDAPQAAVLDRVKAAGRVDYSADAIKVNLAEASLNSADLVAAYQGDVNVLGEAVSANGTLSTLEIPSVSRLAKKAGIENDAAGAIGRLKLEQPLSVNYNANETRLNNVAVTFSEGPFNGAFNGNVTQRTASGDKPDVTVNGTFNGEAASLRRLASVFGTELPPSPTQQPVYENFNMAGNVEGNLNQLNVSLSQLTVDRLNGNGSFLVNMSGSKPDITGRLTIPELDYRPYQAAAQPTDGWSKEPINVDAITKFNADVTLSTSRLITNSAAFGQSDIQTTIRNSLMTVDFPNMALYGGRGNMNMRIDASRQNPVLDMDIALNALDTESFLSKFASFASASGTGATEFKVRGAGLSMDSIMKSLNGDGNFGVKDGSVKGVDMAALLNGVTSGFNFQSALSGLGADKVTDFRDLVGKFSMKNGVMTINDFDFNALGVAANGGGTIDIGNRNVDFSFTPRLTTANANQFARNGIPLKISGDFSSVKTGLDQSAVSSLVASQAQSLIQEQVGGQLGSVAGGVLGSVLGGNSGASSTTSSTGQQPSAQSVIGGLLGGNSQAPSGTSTTTTQQQQPSAQSVLGGLLGGSSQAPSGTSTTTQTQDQTQPQPQPQVQPEDIARDVLGGLFGKKKKKN